MRSIVLIFLVAGCAAPATELKACPTGDCEAEARAAEQRQKRHDEADRLRTPGLLKRAAFDFACSADQLTVVELAEKTRGVSGCGKQATYVWRWGFRDEWILDSAVTAQR